MGLVAGGRGGAEEKKEEEKIPHMCESIGHRPLRGRCPKRGEEEVRRMRRMRMRRDRFPLRVNP